MQGTQTQGFVLLYVGVVSGGQDYQLGAAGYSTSDDTFNVTINNNNPFSNTPYWVRPEGFFFRLQSETIVLASSSLVFCPCSLDVAASSFADPFVTFYDAAGNDITGNYTVSYNPAPFVVATPEPATFATTLTGLLGVVGFVNRRKLASRA
jgi:hypothetical protein